jgi:hypothetical protein
MGTTDEHINWTKRPDGSSNPHLTETAPTWSYGAIGVWLLVGCGLYLLDGVKEGIRWLLQRVVAWWVTRTEKQAASPAVVGEVVAADIAIIELEMDSWFWSEGHPAGGRGCQSHGQNGQGGA